MGCTSGILPEPAKKDAEIQTNSADLKKSPKTQKSPKKLQSSSNVLTSKIGETDDTAHSGRYPSTSVMSKSNKCASSLKSKQNFHSQEKACHAQKPTADRVKFEVLATPVKSESDKKEYKVIRLENGLTACLISDKSPIPEDEENMSEDEGSLEGSEMSETSGSSAESYDDGDECSRGRSAEQKMAAAGLSVGVGSFSDPKHIPGMAHFLEHMVFMGSEKFPAENDFDAFIKRGGGSDNAATDVETTTFHFECLEKNLYEALDKFAQFFTSPLLKRDAMTREREAIESEFQMAIPSDSARREQFLFSLAKADSPVNSFTWGNLITLRDNISDDELYKGVHEFRKRHYSAHRMTLAIQARLPIEELEKYVIECFGNVPNNNLPPDDFSPFATGVFDTPEFTKLYYVKPYTDVTQVELTWALPSLLDKYKSKPHQYLSFLIGDEGKGSLYSYLSKKVWVLSTTVGNGESGSEHNSLFTLFSVSLSLTEEGLEHLYEIIEAVFSYINMLKEIGPQQRIFNELKAITDTSFRFASEEAAVDMVEELSESMQFFPPEDYIAGSELYYEFDPEGISRVLNFLTPEKMNIVVSVTKAPEGVFYDNLEKWFSTQYTEKEICGSWMEQWKSVKPYPEFSIPEPNVYLTNDFSILPDVENHPEYPEKILSDPLVELWYRKDQKFKLPLAYYNFYLISPMSIESAKSTTMVGLFFNLLVLDTREEIYPSRSAELSSSFSGYEKGLLLKVSGYNEKLPVLINVISKHLVTLSDRITPKLFEAVKDKLIKNNYNSLLRPSVLAKDVRLNLLVTNHYTPTECYNSLSEVTFDDTKKFIEDYIKSMYVKVLVQGNVTKEIAVETVKKFVQTVGYEKLSEEDYPRFKVFQIPKGERCARMQSFNREDANSIITNYYQSGPFSIRSSVIMDIVMLIIEEPLFDMLRTKEQLGYHVYASVRDTFGVLGFSVTVNAQATKNTTQYVNERIEEFLKTTHEILDKMSEEELEETKEDLIKMKQCADVHLQEEVDRNWSEIVTDEYIFDRTKQEINAIKEITLDELKKWWTDHNAFGDKANFRKLTIQVVGNDPQKVMRRDMRMARMESETDEMNIKILTIEMLGSEEDLLAEHRPEGYFVNDLDNFKRSLLPFPTTPPKTQ